MNVSVGLIEGRSVIEVELTGTFADSSGKVYKSGRHRLTSEVTLIPSELSSCAFALDDVTIGIGFHWERKERQVFRGALRILKRERGLTAIDEVPLEEYVTSVISSEMSASCPLELLKAHAVISRSWLWFPKTGQPHRGPAQRLEPREICRWYGREAHRDFDVCADDHCQRYQGITKAFSSATAEAVRATSAEFLCYRGAICDARFSKCCGGITERYATAWEDENVPYLQSIYDGTGQSSDHAEAWIRTSPPAYCNTSDQQLLSRLLQGYDRETSDFYRWHVSYSPDQLGELIRTRVGENLGPIRDLQALERGPSGRIYRLKVQGKRDYLIIGKELEIRRALSETHLYSSAFIVEKEAASFVLRGAGWGHGVGLCQIGAAVMANSGKTYKEILTHYYQGAMVMTLADNGLSRARQGRRIFRPISHL